MLNFKKFITFSLTLVIAHLTKGDFLTDTIVNRSQLYYLTKNEIGEQMAIPLKDVDVATLDPSKPYCMSVHGYLGSYKSSSIIPATNGLLATGACHVLAADWSAGSKLLYTTSRSLIGPVGTYFGQMWLNFCNENDIPCHEVFCVGHSLGAHICGNAGKFLKGFMMKIFGLDPAKPGIAVNAPDALQGSDADFVCNIVTGSPVFGQLASTAHITFYPAYGSISQPGCEGLEEVLDLALEQYACNHGRAPILFGEGIQADNMIGLPCQMGAIENKSTAQCLPYGSTITKSSIEQQISAQDHNGDIVFLSLDVPPPRYYGTYYMDTNDSPPYGMGAYTPVPDDY